MELIQIEEDRKFLLAQRERGRQGKMGSIDKQLYEKENRKIERILKQQSYAEATGSKNKVLTQATIPDSSDDASVSSEASADYLPQKWQVKKINPSEMEPPLSKRPKEVVTPELAAALDRTKTRDRNATYVISEALKSVGHRPDEVVLSRQTVRRRRMQFRQSCSENLKDFFKDDVPPTVHWDGKMMSDISGRDSVDRLPVVISGLGVDQLLCVPKIATGTGENMATSVCDAIEDWGVTNNNKSFALTLPAAIQVQ